MGLFTVSILQQLLKTGSLGVATSTEEHSSVPFPGHIPPCPPPPSSDFTFVSVVCFSLGCLCKKPTPPRFLCLCHFLPLPFYSVALRAIVFLSNRNSSPQEGQVGVRLQDKEGPFCWSLSAPRISLRSGGRGGRLSALDGKKRYQERASCQLIPRGCLNRATFPGAKTGEGSGTDNHLRQRKPGVLAFWGFHVFTASKLRNRLSRLY